MSHVPFAKGLHEIGNGVFAWLQPDGGWNLSNAGLVLGDDGATLVDTLTNTALTAEMLAAMRAAIPAAGDIGTIINTHCHPDHCAGNCLLPDARVITSRAADEEMAALAQHDFMADIIGHPERFGSAGVYFAEVMGHFDLRFDAHARATQTFEDRLDLDFGSRPVRLEKVGPAHTRGDTIAWLPQERVLFTGDVLFHEVHPLIDAQSLDAWIAALERLAALDVAVVVPGHGPLTDRSGLLQLRDYMVFFREEGRARHATGMPFDQAVADISLDAFRGWADEERIFMNMASLYRSLGDAPPMEQVMACTLAHRRARCPAGLTS